MYMRFEVGQRVVILDQARCVAPPPPREVQKRFAGRSAIVTRLRKRDDGAWIRLDDGLEVLVFPGECRPE